MIDLHLHSSASDGLLEPAELVRRAAEGGLKAIALTDHDTLAGLPEATAEGERSGVEVIPGVEISLDHREGTLHLIALFVDPDDASLSEALVKVREGRRSRNHRMADRLREHGVPVEVEEADARAGGEVVARPHFALAMLDRGYVSNVKEAFDRYIGKGRPCYVERERLSAEEAFRLIHGAGGVAVLCHPYTLNLDGRPEELLDFVGTLRDRGLDAIEVRYSEPDRAREERYRRIAAELSLLESGGSDFHGHTRRDHRVGLSRKNLDLPYEILEALRERSHLHRRWEQ